MVSRYYCGVGSRDTPQHIQETMTRIARYLTKKGYTLRSGGAKGADIAFEKGAGQDKEIFYAKDGRLEWANELTDVYHPAPDRLSDYARLLMNRNALQVFGQHGDSPVDFLICYTKDGKKQGGTRQAIVLAESAGIPVWNLGKDGELGRFREWVRQI